MEGAITQPNVTRNVRRVTGPTFIMFDLQTTGLVEPHITQISAIEPKSGSMFDNYVRPKKPITPEAHELTGIVHSSGKLFVRGVRVSSTGIKKAIENFLRWLKRFPYCVLIAHNGNSFDFPLLTKTLKRTGFTVRFYRRVRGCIDSLPIFRRKFLGMISYRQIDLVRIKLGKNYPYKAFNALQHSQALAKLVECANMSNEELMEYSLPPERFVRD